jgi:hypothetical protein
LLLLLLLLLWLASLQQRAEAGALHKRGLFPPRQPPCRPPSTARSLHRRPSSLEVATELSDERRGATIAQFLLACAFCSLFTAPTRLPPKKYG